MALPWTQLEIWPYRYLRLFSLRPQQPLTRPCLLALW